MTQSMSEIMNPGAAKKDPDYPHAPSDWDRESAERAARSDNIILKDVHWQVIGVLQSYFAQNQRPNVRALHDALGERFHKSGGLKYLYEQFPGGPVAQGCRFAGLEPPAGAVNKSFGSVQ